MACFLVGGGEAIVVTAAHAAVKKHEIKKGIIDERGNQIADPAEHGICWTRKLTWLMNLLWGGTLLLIVDHIASGELVFWPPFFTAMLTPDGTAAMLNEIATVGVAMAVTCTVVWFVATLIADFAVKRSARRAMAKQS